MRLNKILVLLFVIASFTSVKSGDSISVFIFLSETCPICQNQTLTLRQLYNDFSDKGISFTGVFPNLEFSSKQSIDMFGKKYKIDFALTRDEEQKLTKRYSTTTTPEVIVLNNQSNQVLYRGKVDNSFEAIGKKRQVITEHYLRWALESVLSGQPVQTTETKPVGCFIVKD